MEVSIQSVLFALATVNFLHGICCLQFERRQNCARNQRPIERLIPRGMCSACIPLVVLRTLVPIPVTVRTCGTLPELRHLHDEPEVDYPEDKHDDVVRNSDPGAVQVRNTDCETMR
jgi:hypothetical protein